METEYYENEKRTEYSALSREELNQRLYKAREALDRALQLEKEGYTFDGRKGRQWREKDLETIRSVMRAQSAVDASNLHVFGKTL